MQSYFRSLADKALIAKETDYDALLKETFELIGKWIEIPSDKSKPDDPGPFRDYLQALYAQALSPPKKDAQTLPAQINNLADQSERIEQLLSIVGPQLGDWGWSEQIAHLGRKYNFDGLWNYETEEPKPGLLRGFLKGISISGPQTQTQGSPSQTTRSGRQDLNRLHDLEALVKSYVPLIARRLAAELTLSKKIKTIFDDYGFSMADIDGQDAVTHLAEILSGNKWPPALRPNAPASRIRKNFEHWPRAAVGGSFAQTLASALDFRPSAWALARELECQGIYRKKGPSEHASPPAAEPRVTPTDEAWQAGLMGLAFSGGGIRSATFNLGILQGLASLSLLRKFNYLSTVSGGGYIGAWLINWIKRKGVAEVERRLCPRATPDPRDLQLEPIRFLRDFSNYLTPQLGLLSADLWVMVVVWVRNTLLNLLVLLPAILAALLIPRVPELWAQSIASHAWLSGFDCGFPDKYRLYLPLSDGYLFAMLALVVWSSSLIALNLRQFPSDTSDIGTTDPSQRQIFYSRPWGVLMFIVAPTFVGAWFASIELWVHAGDAGYWEWTSAGVWGAIMAAVILWIAKYPRHFSKDADHPKLTLQGVAKTLVIVVTIGAVTALLTMGLERVFALWRGNDLPNIKSSSAVTVFGVPLIVLSLFFLLLLMAGFMSRKLPDAGSKWLVRLRAYIAIYSAIWLVWAGIAIYGPWLYDHLLHLWYAKLPLIAAWLWTTIMGVLAGKSAKTSGGKTDWKTSFGFFATVGPYVFIVGLFLAMSLAAQLSLIGLTEHLSQTSPNQSLITQLLPCYVIHHEWAWSLWIILVASAFLSFWLSFWFDVNEFSLNKFYRSRLVRCYLGASNEERRPNPFTGFDPADDRIALSWFTNYAPKIHPKDPFPGYDGPFPIFNATLNLVHGDELAWQERRGASFVFTPELCGYETPWHARAHPQPFKKLEFLGYRETNEYAYSKPGMHLGIPMSVSGAALSPNSGSYSRAATAFLMTVFNARLGWWFGNPRHKKTWRKAGPTQGLAYLTKELLGLTNDRASFVYVSDGGHFENLAIYELVRRRCRYIVACDGEEDANLAFNGLGNAIRKCRMDFGVEIDIGVDLIKPESASLLSRTHCVVGTIQYPDQVGLGYLVYLKSSIVGNEPEDVLQYRVAHPAFPHQSTGDQWFTESQFESYRRLGLHVAETTFQRAVGDLKDQRDSRDFTQKLFEELRDNWFPPVKAIQSNFTRHAQALDELVREMRADPILIKLRDFLIPIRDAERPTLAAEDEHKIFLFLSSVIQLMENIYIDLDLESNADHPHCAGWIQIFQAWAEAPIFQKAWGRYGWTYGRNFQRFCSRRLGLTI